ncbi:MAG: sugar ABC transporter substrate-binding protein, partial [bacterium]|nr:sugar ABC transporter substrate-binding protein [bacterium]
VLTSLLMFGCDSKEPAQDKHAISAWFHTGRPEESQLIQDQVARFNASQKDVTIKLTLIPEGDYNTQIQAAATVGSLPDVLDLDGPYLANYVWKGHLQPIDGLLDAKVKDDLLASMVAQGPYRGKIYAVGTFDSGLGLYANKQLLLEAQIPLPAPGNPPWTVQTFEEHLEKLAQKDPDGMVLDLRFDYRGEWYTYAFSPIIQSAGGDLIDRETYQKAAGILNGPQAVRAMTRVQKWIQEGYVDPNTDAGSFTGKKVAFSWCGHWEYPRYKEALGTDLVLLPLPNFGTGSKTGMGSWNWAITRHCRQPQQAMRFIHFLLQTDEILAMCRVNGAVPATHKAIAASRLYRQGGPLHPFVVGLQTAVPRPRTPAYPVITAAFQQAFQDIRHGLDVRKALDHAVEVIDRDIQDSMGYPWVTK